VRLSFAACFLLFPLCIGDEPPIATFVELPGFEGSLEDPVAQLNAERVPARQNPPPLLMKMGNFEVRRWKFSGFENFEVQFGKKGGGLFITSAVFI